MIATGMNPFINAQGYAIIGMLSVTVGAVANIILDPIFIFVLDMGIKGAAIATVISQILSALLVFYFLHGKSELKVRWIHINEISECTRHARDIISLGSAGFIMQLTNRLENHRYIIFNTKNRIEFILLNPVLPYSLSLFKV